MAHLTMFFHLPCECDYLSNFQFATLILSLPKKLIFWNEKIQFNHMVPKHGSKYVK
jgi:hypothetical protein